MKLPLRYPKYKKELDIILTPCFNGADTKSRTRDLLITNQLLYQLSYAGINIIIVTIEIRTKLKDIIKKNSKLSV